MLLLEAGGFPHPGLEIPAVGPLFMENGQHLKQYQTQATTARSVSYLVGQTLGGSSAVNGMVFNRGSPSDYFSWANWTGDPGWGYKNMLRHLKKVENYLGDFPSDQHGYSGHITVSRPKYTPGMNTILEAGRFMGYPTADPNGPQQLSFSPIQFSKQRGRRVSSYSGYLKPYLGQIQNLKVVTEATVDRILFDQKGKSALGVVYSKPSGYFGFARSSKEIVLSAGVIGSPAILMRSGVGPKDVLVKAGIPVVKELPVGYNLHDHVVVRMQFMINDSSQVFIPERDLTQENYQKYNDTGEGPYSTHDADNTQAFIASSLGSKLNGISDWADIQLQFVSSGLSATPPVDILPTEVAISCMVFLSRPKSRGRLTLNTTHPWADPILDFQYFKERQDMDILLEGVQKTLQVYEGTPAFKRIAARFSNVPIEECREMVFRSQEYWECFIRERFASGLHGGGTCKMGKGQGDDAVVDTNLRVIGLEGLRVVDASIMPQIINSNLQASVYSVAERSAENILLRWKHRQRDETDRERFASRFRGG